MFVAPLGASGTPTPPAVTNVTLGGATITAAGPSTQSAGLFITSDGEVWGFTTTLGYVQINPSTDWIIPNTDADATYELRIINIVLGPNTELGFSTGAMVEDEWISLAQTRSFLLITAGVGFTPRSVTFDLEIRKDGGANLVGTASFTMSATED